MIIVKLQGGLGNQLFQYALGRHLSEIHNTELKVDISLFETYTLHDYSLKPFNIREIIASPDEVASLKYRKIGVFERIMKVFLRKPYKLAKSHINEKYFHYDPEILSLPDRVYLDGYWQSEKYFINIAKIIRQEFTVKTPQTGKDKEIAARIASCDSVSLHIRRGTYLTFPHNSVHGTCSLDYYFRSVERISRTIEHPHFFLFSDDPEWACDNLKLSYPITVVDHNGADKDYEDLRLMSQCKHHIIANSTFSWWGAWLCENPNKIIFAPKQWFITDQYNTKDLIPERWIRI